MVPVRLPTSDANKRTMWPNSWQWGYSPTSASQLLKEGYATAKDCGEVLMKENKRNAAHTPPSSVTLLSFLTPREEPGTPTLKAPLRWRGFFYERSRSN
jgi:hypothetical protein